MRANCPTHDKGRFGSNPAVAVLHGRRFTCSQLPSVRRKCVCIARDVFSVAGNSVWFAGRVFASIAAAIGPSQPFWHRSQRICVADNRLRSASGIFCAVPSVFLSRATRFGSREDFLRRLQLRRGLSQHFCVVPNAFALRATPFRSAGRIFAPLAACLRSLATPFGSRGAFLRRSQLRSVRRNRFCIARSCDRCIATLFSASAAHSDFSGAEFPRYSWRYLLNSQSKRVSARLTNKQVTSGK